jgi:hypothetical protein
VAANKETTMTATRRLPEHLYAAFNWIDSAGEWEQAMSDGDYARAAYHNALENDVTDVTEADLQEVIEWHRQPQ